MKTTSLTVMMMMALAVPALAHPGSAHDHANLSAFQHAVVTALPVAAILIVAWLAVALFRRKA